MTTKKENPTKVVTGLVRCSYPHLDAPYAFGDEKARFSVTILIPKSDKKTINAINEAMQAAFEEGGEKMFGNLPFKSVKVSKPLRDGDDEVAEKPEKIEYNDMLFLKASSDRAPKLVDRDLQPILNPNEIYAGCWIRVSLKFYAYDNVQKGIGVWLNNVQFWKDDTPFGSAGSDPEEDFSDGFEDDYDESLD